MSGITVACISQSILCWCMLASWAAPFLSQQQQMPGTYDHNLQEVNKEAKEQKKQKKSALREKVKCAYLAHQKNRLAYFADHDGFIWFDDKENEYSFFLSNFYPVNMKIWDMKFYCSEAAFQAAKFLDKPEIAVRFTHLDGEDAWKLAQKLSYQQRGDWYQVREKIMLEVLQAKFQQHPELNELLLATGDAYLVENTARDAFWADGGDGKGKNRLGNLLMQIRGQKGGIGIVPRPAKYEKFVD
jgi:ribA/ribD-fused uncharacterized protein